MNLRQRLMIGACGILIAGGVMDGVARVGIVVPPASAVVGRPATPVSVAGVTRRTTRRVIRRSAIYASTLPVGCSSIYIDGAMVYQCGATYYQPYNNQYVVVYVD